jgi:uncharacterized protein (DUF1697 family)
MANTQYLALLRGINVGGKNIIKMRHLKACFEASKLENVATYIQSGNVLFETAETDTVKLVRTLESALSKAFSPYKVRIVLCSHARLRQIVRKAPKGFGLEPQKYRYDVIFLREPLTASQPKGCDHKAWSGRSIPWSECIVFFETDSESEPKPFGAYCCTAGLPGHDNS